MPMKHTNRLYFSLIAATLLIGIVADWGMPVAHAFKSLASEPPGHIQQTYQALERITLEDPVTREPLRFTSKAKKEIKDANVHVDVGYSGFIGIGFLSAQKHFDSETFSPGSTLLLNLKADVIRELTRDPPNGEAARWWLGTALHTLQDYYSHSTWVDYAVVQVGSPATDTRLGAVVFDNHPTAAPGIITCADNGTYSTLAPHILDGIGGTSGYFPLPDPCATGWPFEDFTPAGKCRHGLSGLCDGINKDDPRWPLYGPAFGLAVDSTVEYVNLILNHPAVKTNRKAIRALLGIEGGTLGMVIDDTASMDSVIGVVKTTVSSMIDAVRFDETRAPEDYLLVPFGDPHVGPAFVTADPDLFLARVNAISVSGGDDCPELSQTAFLTAIALSSPDSRLYLFTDASAKDASLSSSVNARAREKRIQLYPILTGSCSPYDPVYFSNARETGGQVIVTTSSNVGEVFNLIEPQLSGDSVTILSRTENFTGALVLRPFPVDDTASNLMFSLFFDTSEGGEIYIPTVELVRPSGNTVLSTDPGVTMSIPGNGRIILVEDPEEGEWNLRILAQGETQYAVTANSPLNLRDFRFVETGGRIAHEGFFPIAGQPVAGTTPQATASLEGPFSSTGFAFVDEAGGVLQNITMTLEDAADSPENFTGTAPPPSVPFYVIAAGNTSGGQAYRRQFAPLFRPQSVEVMPSETTPAETIANGATTTLRYHVTNHGAPATFNLEAAVSHGTVSQITPSALTLATNETGDTDIDLVVAAGTETGTRAQITVTASRSDDAVVTNTLTDTRVVFPDQTLPPAAAVLPSSRSPQVGNTVTAFATIINVGQNTAARCTISPATEVPVEFFFQATDPATNAVIGAQDLGMDIPAGGSQSFVFALTPTAAFAPVELELNFDCRNSDPALALEAINTLLISASDTPVPDVVALGATLNNDGVVNLSGPAGSGAFSVATINLGASANITVSALTGSGNPPVAVSLCETNPATGVCISDIAASVTTFIASNATPTFGVFVQAQGVPIPFDPAANRILVRFADASGIVRGGTSVAVTTDVPAPINNDNFASAITLTGPAGTTTATNVDATKEPGEPAHGGNSGGKSLWWRWTASSSSSLTVDTFGSDFDTTLGVYTGTSVDALTTVASNDDSGSLQSSVTFAVTPGTTYYIAVDGYSGASGTIVLNWGP